MKSREEIISGNYRYFLESGAPYEGARAFDPLCMDRTKGLVPDMLRAFWRTYGLGTSHKGLVQFCDPQELAFSLEEILGDDPEFRPTESVVYAYTAFGKLCVWNSRWGMLSIDLPYLRVVPFRNGASPSGLDWDETLASALASLGFNTCDRRDTRNHPLFERAVKEFGRLAFGEVYGFFPAIGLGGAPELKNLQRVQASVHFSILAELGPFTLMDATHYPPRPLRQIG
ncbi:MAG: T6SS immunity protein Tdi1 domain-containing protein [Xanthobacteraceae bacterium]